MNKRDISASSLVSALSVELRKVKEIKPPSWSAFVKTGSSRERPPTQEDWWYTRSASILNKVSDLGPIGTAKLRVHYGGRKNMGYAPEKFRPGSTNIIRTILKQLEEAKLVKQVDKDGRKGRVLTPAGISLLHKTANGTKQK